ncbi:2-hydroxyacid dehydrogenase [Flavobacterium sp. TSSA_36]|uniref:2-hydroxyacid dehydrogenase n=1 Tax=Flavobacterium sp. TSSA_36 TaxID=3447669 RepID=UPI003F2F8724
MKIAITESQNFSKTGLEKLKTIADVQQYDFKTIKELIQRCKNVDVLFVRLRFKFTKEVLIQLPNVKFILSATTGTDHIDEDFFVKRGGKIICLKGETEFLEQIPSTAEHTWGLLLSLVKKIPFSFDEVKKGNWNRDSFKGNNLKNKKIAILGMGRVGKQVAKIANCFDMEVGFYDIKEVDVPYLKFDSPITLFEWADIISVHIPQNKSNENYIDKKLLSHINKTSVLINTSRGGIWDEDTLCEMIWNKEIKGVATDVLRNELDNKIDKNGLVSLSQKGFPVIITPHIAGATIESMEMTEEFIVNKFINCKIK